MKQRFNNLLAVLRKLVNKSKAFYTRHQRLFLVVLSVGFIGLLIGSFIIAPTKEEISEVGLPTRQVKTFVVNGNRIEESVTGNVVNHSAVTLVAQQPGPISKLYVSTGQKVKTGQWITYQTTAYNTGNTATVQREIAQKNALLADEQLKNTVEIVSKNRELADINRDNTEELRKISEQSRGITRDIVDLLKVQISDIEARLNNTTTPPDADTTSTLRGQLTSLKSSLSQTEQSLKNLDYSTDTDNPPTKLANINRDLVYSTTELQLKSAQLGKEIAHLSAKAAHIQETAARVSAPFAGTVDRIFIEVGQYVTPGTPVAKLVADDNFQIIARVSSDIALRIQDESQIQLKLAEQTLNLTDYHVTLSPTAGQLHEVIINIPTWLNNRLFEGEIVNLTLPINPVAHTADTTYIPLDAVFVTNTSQFVYVEENNVAARRIVDSGTIFGNKIEIKSGLMPGEGVILDRRINANQPVEVISNE